MIAGGKVEKSSVTVEKYLKKSLMIMQVIEAKEKYIFFYGMEIHPLKKTLESGKEIH